MSETPDNYHQNDALLDLISSFPQDGQNDAFSDVVTGENQQTVSSSSDESSSTFNDLILIKSMNNAEPGSRSYPKADPDHEYIDIEHQDSTFKAHHITSSQNILPVIDSEVKEIEISSQLSGEENNESQNDDQNDSKVISMDNKNYIPTGMDRIDEQCCDSAQQEQALEQIIASNNIKPNDGKKLDGNEVIDASVDVVGNTDPIDEVTFTSLKNIIHNHNERPVNDDSTIDDKNSNALPRLNNGADQIAAECNAIEAHNQSSLVPSDIIERDHSDDDCNYSGIHDTGDDEIKNMCDEDDIALLCAPAMSNGTITEVMSEGVGQKHDTSTIVGINLNEHKEERNQIHITSEVTHFFNADVGNFSQSEQDETIGASRFDEKNITTSSSVSNVCNGTSSDITLPQERTNNNEQYVNEITLLENINPDISSVDEEYRKPNEVVQLSQGCGDIIDTPELMYDTTGCDYTSNDQVSNEIHDTTYEAPIEQNDNFAEKIGDATQFEDHSLNDKNSIKNHVEKESYLLLESENEMLRIKLKSALDQIRSVENQCIEHEETIGQLQDKLTIQMTSRAEVENKLKESIKQQNSISMEINQLRDQIDINREKFSKEKDTLQSTISSITDENKRMAFELSKSRQHAESLEMSATSLTSRLNEAKKVEATKTREARRNADKVVLLEEELYSMKNQSSKQESLQQGAIEKLKSLEEVLDKERQLNITRKSKMKNYVDQKSGEMKSLKETNIRLNQELNIQKSEKNEITQRKIDLENEVSSLMNKMSLYSSLQNELGLLKEAAHESEKETEDLKKKRITAKHEMMTLLRSLELERTISSKLQHELKYTLLPKALSQQELLSESLLTLQSDLEVLTRTKFSGQAALYEANHEIDEDSKDELEIDTKKDDSGALGDSSESFSKYPAYIRLINDVEIESKKVSMAILALTSNVDKLHELTVNDIHYSVGEKNCVSALTDYLMGASVQTGSLSVGANQIHGIGYANVTQNN